MAPAIGKGDGGRGVGVGEQLKNRVVFTWAFLEMLGWFWVSLLGGVPFWVIPRGGVREKKLMGVGRFMLH